MYVSRSPLGMSHSQHKMPVGIQMFATITSKHHFQTLQRDLRGLASGPRAPRYEDTLVVCSDGSRQASRLILGLILPELATVTSFSLLPEVTLLMPEHSTADLDRLVSGLLADDVMGAWPHSLNSLIDTLKPEAAGRLPRIRTATLHSEVTKETVVLHASNEDEVDDVLVVNEEQGEDNVPEPISRHRSSISEQYSYPDGLSQPPVIRHLPGLNVQPQHDNPPSNLILPPTSLTPNKSKPPTYVPIPSKKDKSKTTISPSVRGIICNLSRQSELSPEITSPRSRPLEIKPKSRSLISVEQTPRGSSTRVSRVAGHEVSPELRQPQPQPRTTEIRPVSAEARPVFPCPICHERFLGQDIMETHMKLHSDKHKCTTCGLVFIKARELIEHQRIHSGARLVRCYICDKDFTEKGLRLHTERFHKILEVKSQIKRTSKENISYSEDKISFTSSSEDSDDPDDPGEISSDEEVSPKRQKKVLAKIKSNPVEKRTDQCEICDKYFTKKGLKLHQMRHHKNDNEDEALRKLVKPKKNPPLKKLFTCVYCEKKFSHLASMKVHEKVHLGGKPHQCDMCEAKFSNKFDLFAHEKTHSASRPHKCDECTETFKTAESLRFHKLIHEESQPNVCQFCKKTFKNRNQLELHERVHIGEKPFSCTGCDQSFETAGKLTRHITSTHMTK